MLGGITRGLTQAMGRKGSALLARAWEAGRPRMADVAMNGFASGLYGLSMLQQGANPLEAGGTALTDLGLQMGLDAGFGTAGAGISRRLAPRGMPKAELMERMANHASMAKMGSMVSTMIPNPVAESFYQRKTKEQQGYEQQLLTQSAPVRPGPMDDGQVMENRIAGLAGQYGVDPSDPLTRLYLSQM
jgi:hypothetical protein